MTPAVSDCRGRLRLPRNDDKKAFFNRQLVRIDIINTPAYLRQCMDEYFELNGITFIWDQAKARKNLSKHGVAFEQAAEAFFDPFLRVVEARSEDVARDAILGMDERWNLLFIVHLEIEDDRIRIISTRKATRSERRRYED